MDEQKLTEIIEPLFTASFEELMEKYVTFPEKSFQHMPETFWDTLKTAVNEYNICGKPIAYIQFSYLLCSAYLDKLLLKIDIYDESYILDPHTINCFWNYTDIFPSINKQLDDIINKARLQSARISPTQRKQLKFLYQLQYFMVLKELFTTYLSLESSSSRFEKILPKGTTILYGGYLNKTQRIMTI